MGVGWQNTGPHAHGGWKASWRHRALARTGKTGPPRPIKIGLPSRPPLVDTNDARGSASHLFTRITHQLRKPFKKASQMPGLFLSFFLFALVFDSLFPPFSLDVFILLSLSFFLPLPNGKQFLPPTEPIQPARSAAQWQGRGTTIQSWRLKRLRSFPISSFQTSLGSLPPFQCTSPRWPHPPAFEQVSTTPPLPRKWAEQAQGNNAPKIQWRALKGSGTGLGLLDGAGRCPGSLS